MQERDHDLNLEWTNKKKSTKKKPQTNMYLILQIYYILQNKLSAITNMAPHANTHSLNPQLKIQPLKKIVNTS